MHQCHYSVSRNILCFTLETARPTFVKYIIIIYCFRSFCKRVLFFHLVPYLRLWHLSCIQIKPGTWMIHGQSFSLKQPPESFGVGKLTRWTSMYMCIFSVVHAIHIFSSIYTIFFSLLTSTILAFWTVKLSIWDYSNFVRWPPEVSKWIFLSFSKHVLHFLKTIQTAIHFGWIILMLLKTKYFLLLL